MSITPEEIISLAKAELMTVSDKRVIEHIETLLVVPQFIILHCDFLLVVYL